LQDAVSCCLSATGVRFSVIRFPPRSWALLTVGLPANRPDLDGVTAFRTHELQPGRVPSVPRGRRCSPQPGGVPDQRPPHLNGNVPAPRLKHSTWPGFTSRGITEGSSNSPVRSSPHPPPPGWNEQPLRLSPELRTPPTKSRTAHVGVGTGQLSTDLEQRSTTSADLQSSAFAHNVRPRRRNTCCESWWVVGTCRVRAPPASNGADA
jgi:hypothetical protein